MFGGCSQSVNMMMASKYQHMWIEDSNRREFIKITEQQFKGRYQLVEMLGKGSYGEVHRARSSHGQIVAIKQFRHQAMQQFQMIIREISNLKRLDHPNILKFYDCYIVDDYRYYMVTEFCPGGALPDYIGQVTTQGGKILLCLQMAEGLAYAHEYGIVHRDLKPQNILIGQRNVAKIGDFGCSTRLDQGSDVMVSRLGSPAFMDYRVGRRQEYDYTVDLYSLAMVFLWVFSGRGIYDQFRTLTDLNHYQSQISKDYQNNIQPYIEPLPAPINVIVKNCLSPDYQQRFTAKKIAEMISASISKESSTNMVSTQDELDGLQSNRLHFAYTLMSFHKDFDRRYRNEKIRDSTLQLLLTNQQALDKLKAVSKLRYVSPDTKSKFVFLVFLYYLSWLEQMGLLVEGKPSHVAKRYPQIDPKAADSQLLELVQQHIKKERERVSLAILKCSEKIQGTLHLVSKDKYLPRHFKDFVRTVYQREKIPLSLLQEREHLNNVEEFFTLRVKVEYNYIRGNQGPADKGIELVGEIARSFQ